MTAGRPTRTNTQCEHGGTDRERLARVCRRYHLWRRRHASSKRFGQRVPPGQRGCDRQRGRGAVARCQLDAPLDRARNRDVEILHHAVDTRRTIGRRSAVRERRPAREHLVKHEAKRVEVALHRDLSPFELLRGHVRWRAAAQLRVFQFASGGRQPKIGDRRPARGRRSSRLRASGHDAPRPCRAPPPGRRTADARSRSPCPEVGVQCGAAATRDPRRRCTPSRFTRRRPPRRCHTRGTRSGARSGAPGALRCETGPAAADRERLPPEGT